MFQKQKETILSLVKADDQSKDFTNHYLLPYKDFFDIHDDFTEFQCERTTGKADYLSLADQFVCADKHAQVFIEIYSFEEDGDDTWIYSDTFIMFSQFPLLKVKQIFNVPDIVPSDIGDIEDLSEKYVVINEDGRQCPITDFCHEGSHSYYCWWD